MYNVLELLCKYNTMFVCSLGLLVKIFPYPRTITYNIILYNCAISSIIIIITLTMFELILNFRNSFDSIQEYNLL